MKAIRRGGMLLFVLCFGIIFGIFYQSTALLFILPLFLIWLMIWDEKSYRRFLRKQQKQQHMLYKK